MIKRGKLPANTNISKWNTLLGEDDVVDCSVMTLTRYNSSNTISSTIFLSLNSN